MVGDFWHPPAAVSSVHRSLRFVPARFIYQQVFLRHIVFAWHSDNLMPFILLKNGVFVSIFKCTCSKGFQQKFQTQKFPTQKLSTKASDTQVPKKGTCFIGSWNCHLPSCCCTWFFCKSGGWWNQNHYRRNHPLEEELNLEVTQKNKGRLSSTCDTNPVNPTEHQV